MSPSIKIGIIGDFAPVNPTHVATNAAIQHAADALAMQVQVVWVPTLPIASEGTAPLRSFDALWCSPGSPYASMDGALAAIRLARENNIPFFGT